MMPRGRAPQSAGASPDRGAGPQAEHHRDRRPGHAGHDVPGSRPDAIRRPQPHRLHRGGAERRETPAEADAEGKTGAKK